MKCGLHRSRTQPSGFWRFNADVTWSVLPVASLLPETGVYRYASALWGVRVDRGVLCEQLLVNLLLTPCCSGAPRRSASPSPFLSQLPAKHRGLQTSDISTVSRYWEPTPRPAGFLGRLPRAHPPSIPSAPTRAPPGRRDAEHKKVVQSPGGTFVAPESAMEGASCPCAAHVSTWEDFRNGSAANSSGRGMRHPGKGGKKVVR
jgi:hypothetical protein